MARKHNGDAFYEAGTVNEELDEYDLYEQDGQLYMNKGGEGSSQYVKMDGVSRILEPRDTDVPAADLEMHESALYVLDDAGTYKLQLAFSPDGSSVVVNTLDADLSS